MGEHHRRRMSLSRHSLVLILALVAFAVSLPTNDGDTWEEHAPAQDWIQSLVDSAVGPNDNVEPVENFEDVEAIAVDNGDQCVLLDGGSQGTKLFTWKKGNTNPPVPWGNAFMETFCDRAANMPNKGLASLAYAPATCKQNMFFFAPQGAGKDEVGNSLGPSSYFDDQATKYKCTDGTCIENYRKELLGAVATYYTKLNGGTASNAKRIPLLATAGMRMVSQADNKKVWEGADGNGGVCKQVMVGAYKLDAAGTPDSSPKKYCGTIPGTTEAFYEFIGAVGKNNKLLGSFTCGGASAQISIPLKNKKEEDSFKSLIEEVAMALDCKKMTLPNGANAPSFNAGGLNALKAVLPANVKHALNLKMAGNGFEKVACVRDYIDIKQKSDLPKTTQGTVGSIKSVGLISFLNLHSGASKLIAGGATEMKNWAAEKCKTKTFDECSKDLKELLKVDPFWKAVTGWFDKTKLSLDYFAFSTANARYDEQTFPKATDGANLATKLRTICTANDPATHPDKVKPPSNGITTKNGCMGALWASLYITAFFGDPSVHPTTEAHMGKDADWSDGALAAGLPTTLMQMPVTHSNFHYMDGVSTEINSN